MDLKETLGLVPLFSEFPEDELRRLVEIGSHRSREAGQILFRTGDPGDSLYVILDGAVRVFQSGGQGEQVELARLGPGDTFGEMGLVDGAPRSASAETLEPSELFLIGRDPFLELLARSPQMLAEALRGFSRKIRETNERLFRLALENERQRTRAETERRRFIGQIVAGVARELDAPLDEIDRTASAFLDRARAGGPEPAEPAPDQARRILSHTARARSLIRALSSLSRHQGSERSEPVDLGKLVADIASGYPSRSGAANLEIDVRDESGEKPAGRMWEGDREALAQVLINLLDNAGRHAYGEGKAGRVEIVVRPDYGYAPARFELAVTDFGRGISDTDLPHLFEPFFSTRRSEGAAGLGLAVAHHLVTSALGGSIQVRSEPGDGARFTLYLPQKAGPGT